MSEENFSEEAILGIKLAICAAALPIQLNMGSKVARIMLKRGWSNGGP
jgi:hypothetical protein